MCIRDRSTIDRLLRIFDLFEPLRATIASGVPTLGTCAGLVLLAKTVLDPAPGQQSLGLLDIDVRRNAFGSQVDSAEVDLDTADGPATVAFIRAPRVDRVGPSVQAVSYTHLDVYKRQPLPRFRPDSAPFQTGPTPTVHFRTCNRTSICLLYTSRCV